MAKLPVVSYMRVTSQDKAAHGADAYVFHHEADDDLLDIADSYERGMLSPQQARQRLLKYQDFIDVPDIVYDEDEDEDEDEDVDFEFPFRSDDYGFRAATDDFESDAAALAIPGVSYVHGTDFYGNHFQVLEVRDDDALTELQERLKDRYKIVGGAW